MDSRKKIFGFSDSNFLRGYGFLLIYYQICGSVLQSVRIFGFMVLHGFIFPLFSYETIPLSKGPSKYYVINFGGEGGKFDDYDLLKFEHFLLGGRGSKIGIFLIT